MRSLYWLKPFGSSYKEVKLNIPDSGKCIFTNIGDKFIVKNTGIRGGNRIVNKIYIRHKIENVEIQ